MNDKQKIKSLIKLLNEALIVAGEAWELADAYAGGESESADAISDRIDDLEAKFDKLVPNS
jgi:hypothetical protein